MTEAIIIDGKEFSSNLRNKIAEDVKAFKKERNVVPGLAVVLVGEDPASRIYVRKKEEMTTAVGMNSLSYRLDTNASQQELLDLIETLNHDPAVHGILVQLPLPKHIDTPTILEAIDPDKDVDGFHVVNAGRLAIGTPSLVPCTPAGCMMLLEHSLGSLKGKNALVIGRSTIVGRPMAQLLLAADCTVTVAHRHTKNLEELCRQADIVVAAVGIPHFVKASWLKPGAVVIDVGINRVPAEDEAAKAAGKTRIVGDVDFVEAAKVASAITPVPGGVGPMTIACLLNNTVQAARNLTSAS
ncbi:methenyltetrahydrofolate cyclohydrolase /5,10-methylenetetrahydrofolate dehydrogenase (NADP+) [Zymomonas mobilis]|uniref:bifunctional methylenetetrahydrofolate dehydrogenase/methenyltetrahydrofolate cyclohydrolase FolD n=1 Tax=Zymomonas mobilis TaxID=542 RepID=UPI00026D8A4D|nr:bifunctional methylenetetrahydrofolate dehydrogenase/methenyltetrahydrofolate cyclohydrolase FolD [Zymomonas mobilis]AFN56288.1 Bifunctional protein folD [Zymomonas mobilis subsp. mobilis ATCC 29191]TQK78282.1 methenyltetrahydrofolate cyclohydrolase /5,10-methylenetetrahydrofolate dehydrogenase (NADP+) [Zymomonas mobilis]TQL15071.1 methenyltetrahydrofolate cyclohydrolase /5,10-methylenetetrahydrofolate dehydrogenase (NADP+) [Zymomonas mobilis]GEB87603.1 bifunctional protein FolD [Zymomonas m